MKKFLALLLAATMALTLAACGSSSSSDTSDDASSDTTEESTDDSTESAGKYAIILKTQSTSFWQTMYSELEAYAEENGIELDLYNANSDDDDAGQLAIVEQCINSGEYDVIGLAPVNSSTLVSAVKEANDAGIPVVNIDEQFNEEEMESQGATAVGFVSSDNEAIGYLGAEYLCSLIEEGSNVAIVEGIAGNTSSEDRTSGATSAFEDYGMNIVQSVACDWDAETALNTVEAWLNQDLDIKAIYVCNDGMAVGVRQAVAAAGVDVYVCGTDGDDDAIEAVAGVATDGISMTATVAQDPGQIGITALELMMDVYANPDSYEGSAAPEKTPVDAILITADNAADYIE